MATNINKTYLNNGPPLIMNNFVQNHKLNNNNNNYLHSGNCKVPLFNYNEFFNCYNNQMKCKNNFNNEFKGNNFNYNLNGLNNNQCFFQFKN